jgi:hypothetical protein
MISAAVASVPALKAMNSAPQYGCFAQMLRHESDVDRCDLGEQGAGDPAPLKNVVVKSHQDRREGGWAGPPQGRVGRAAAAEGGPGRRVGRMARPGPRGYLT